MEGRTRSSISRRESRAGLLDVPSLCFFPGKRLGFPEPHGHTRWDRWRAPLCQLLEQLPALLFPMAIPGPDAEPSLAAA